MILTLKDWYQLDFALPAPKEAKSTLLKVDNVMDYLRKKELATEWFFLYEGDSIRVRMKSAKKDSLESAIKEEADRQGLDLSSKLPFSEYQESDEHMFNEDFLKGFVKIMCEVSFLAVARAKGNLNFDTYRAMERLDHCIFDVLGTLSFKGEPHFLQQRFLEKIGQPFDEDFEDKVW